MKKRKVFIIFLVSLIIFVFGYYLAFNQNKYVSYNDETKQFVHTDTSKNNGKSGEQTTRNLLFWLSDLSLVSRIITNTR